MSRSRRRLFCLLLLLLVAVCRAQFDPKPNPAAVVQVGKARFTVLTEWLIRMEWGQAVDAATFTFINRNLPTPKYNHTTVPDTVGKNWTIISTDSVQVDCRKSLTSANNINPTCTGVTVLVFRLNIYRVTVKRLVIISM